ncbi:hypothetical protein D3C76_1404790 [compost metagenome]
MGLQHLHAEQPEVLPGTVIHPAEAGRIDFDGAHQLILNIGDELRQAQGERPQQLGAHLLEGRRLGAQEELALGGDVGEEPVQGFDIADAQLPDRHGHPAPG